MSIPVGYPDLVLGTTVSLDHIDGKTLEIKIPKGATAGETLEIHGRGLPRQRGGRGNIVILLKLHIPTKLDKTTKKRLQELKESLGVSPKDFGDKVREQAEERRQ
jgi:molecular chaperone DnaJ